MQENARECKGNLSGIQEGCKRDAKGGETNTNKFEMNERIDKR